MGAIVKFSKVEERGMAFRNTQVIIDSDVAQLAETSDKPQKSLMQKSGDITGERRAQVHLDYAEPPPNFKRSEIMNTAMYNYNVNKTCLEKERIWKPVWNSIWRYLNSNMRLKEKKINFVVYYRMQPCG